MNTAIITADGDVFHYETFDAEKNLIAKGTGATYEEALSVVTGSFPAALIAAPAVNLAESGGVTDAGVVPVPGVSD